MNTNFVLFAERMIARPARQTFSHSTKNREHDHPLIHFVYDFITNLTHKLKANLIHSVSEFKNKCDTEKRKIKNISYLITITFICITLKKKQKKHK